jgi:NADPH:quinone reductase-like Zn-dependent oxidoreductase
MTASTLTSTAQAWVMNAYGVVEDLELREIELPPPTGTQVLVATEAASLNPLDLKLLSGSMKDFMPVTFPFVPGSDVCGTVLAAGPDAVGFAEGDRIVAMVPTGAMATRVLCDTSGAIARVLEGPAWLWASLPEAGMAALAVMDEAGLQAGQRVAILGATGGIGLLACQMASRAGAHVIATATPPDVALVTAHGATDTVDYTTPGAMDALAARHPGGLDVVIDLVHQGADLVAAAAVLRPGGRLVSTLMGPPAAAFGRSVDVRYVRLAPSAASLQRLVDAVNDGRLKTTVTQRFEFARVPQAYLAMRDTHARGKLIVEQAPLS